MKKKQKNAEEAQLAEKSKKKVVYLIIEKTGNQLILANCFMLNKKKNK